MGNKNTAIESERETLMIRTLWLNVKVFALAAGFICGLGILTATLWLVVKGGNPVGPHLKLLGQFFWGYRVTFAGSFIGFGYGFVVGAVGGGCIGGVYNRLAIYKDNRRPE